jgi:hypothetical protein
LNDAREFLHAVQMMRQLAGSRAGGETVRDLLDRVLPGLASINVCVASFSEVPDSLSQWRAYAPRGGFCIGIRGNRLADLAAAHQFFFAPCLYKRDQQEKLVHALIEQLEENIAGRTGQHAEQRSFPGGGLPAYAPILKDPAFFEEREWRIISRPQKCTGSRFDFREGNSMLIPFYRFPLECGTGPMPIEEIIVGPTPDPERSAQSIRSFLASQGLAEVKVNPSVVPYRDW